MQCKSCGIELEQNFGVDIHPLCYTCKSDLIVGAAVVKKSTQQIRAFTYVLILIAAVLFVYLWAFNHIVIDGEEIGLIKKSTISFSETIINMDKITGMPLFMAKIQYPLSIKSLQASGMIESDEDFMNRVTDNVTEAVNKATAQYQDMMNRANAQALEQQKQLKKQLERQLKEIESMY